jgi:signal transduction histidine kinase
MKSLSSRLKIALLSAGISGAVLVAFGGLMWLLIYDQRLASVDREIRTLGSRHPGLLAGRGSFDRLASSLEFTFGDDYTNQVLLLVRDVSGRITYQSPHWPAAIEPARLGWLAATNDVSVLANAPSNSTSAERGGQGHGGYGRGFGQGRGGPPVEVSFTKPPKFFTVRTAPDAWRFGVMSNDEVMLVLGLNQSEVELELNRVRNAFLLTLPAALFLVGLGGWVVAGRALRPLKAIADTAERVTVRGLEQRIPDAGDSPETRRVIQVLNGMMDRLEISFRQAIRFSADASHELKTPLAIMQGELENALQSAAPGSSEQQLFSNLLEETQRLKNITRSLLLLAQADAGQLTLALETVDVSAELEAMMEDARVLAADGNLRFDLAIPPHLRVEADRALLHMAMFNVISNALKYNRADGQVAVRLEAVGQKLVLSVGNTGPDIPPEEQAKIFDRFFRANRSGGAPVDGIGLGLSLAREIVRAHGGELTLKKSREGWTSFELTLADTVERLAGSEPRAIG